MTTSSQVKEVHSVPLKLLGVESVPASFTKILAEGPKFALEPKQNPLELLELVRKVAYKASPTEKDKCIVEGVRTLNLNAIGCRGRQDLRSLKRFFVDNDLSLIGCLIRKEALLSPLARSLKEELKRPW